MKQEIEKQQFSLLRRLEIVIAGCLYYSGLVNLARWWTRRSGPTLSILCYHQASGGSFRAHLLYLRRHYRLLHLEAALEELYQIARGKHTNRDGRPMLVLTSDDGYRDLYSDALPLLQELQAPLTVFLVPGYIESGQRFWWQEPENLFLRTQVHEVTFEERTYHLDDPQERQLFWRLIDTRLLCAPSVAAREAFLEKMHMALAVSSVLPLSEAEEALAPLTWAQIHAMEQSEWISFGAHTMHHPTLAYLISPAELAYEVSECRAVLEQQLGHPVRTFAYPIGKEEHFAPRDVQAVKAAAYAWAVTAIHGLNTSRTDPHQLYRIVVDVDQHWLMIAVKASGLWDFLVHPGRKSITFLRNMFK